MPRYANVVSTLALFAALGGTATAAATLDRDSVGAPQIRDGAVRSAEIRDASVRIGDLAPGARSVLDTRVRIAEGGAEDLRACPGADPTGCPVIASRTLATGNWLIVAKLGVASPDGTGGARDDRCGLVAADAVPGPRLLDTVRIGDVAPSGSAESMSLMAVVSDVVGTPAVTVRCTVGQFEETDVTDVKLTALEVGAVTGP